jgi:adenylate kinase
VAPLIIVHGPTRAGKSSQAERLAQRHGYLHFSSGQVLRNTKDPAIMQRMAEGKLARSEDILRLMKAQLSSAPADMPIVIDGFPRMLPEFKEFERWLPEMNRQLTHMIEISITPEESHKRGEHRGRGDDEYEAVEFKWGWYRSDVVAVIEYSRSRYATDTIDGIGTPDEVAARIEAVL